MRTKYFHNELSNQLDKGPNLLAHDIFGYLTRFPYAHI